MPNDISNKELLSSLEGWHWRNLITPHNVVGLMAFVITGSLFVNDIKRDVAALEEKTLQEEDTRSAEIKEVKEDIYRELAVMAESLDSNHTETREDIKELRKLLLDYIKSK